MNWDIIEGKWTELRGKARARWAEVTDSDWDRIGGRKDQMVGLLQQKYGRSREEAERDVDDWQRSL